MTVTQARAVLVTIFLVGWAVQVVAVILTYSEGAIAYGDLTSLLTKLLAVYSVHFGVIFGGIFAQQQDGNSARVPATAFYLAVAASLIWNALLAWRSIMFSVAAYDPSKDDSSSQLMAYIETIASASSFLVVGALAFFFAKR
jgi:hypothetical protein